MLTLFANDFHSLKSQSSLTALIIYPKYDHDFLQICAKTHEFISPWPNNM